MPIFARFEVEEHGIIELLFGQKIEEKIWPVLLCGFVDVGQTGSAHSLGHSVCVCLLTLSEDRDHRSWLK